MIEELIENVSSGREQVKQIDNGFNIGRFDLVKDSNTITLLKDGKNEIKIRPIKNNMIRDALEIIWLWSACFNKIT
jgi:hypothetical protein